MTYPNFTEAIVARIARPDDRMAELDAIIAAGCPDPDLSDLTAEDFAYIGTRRHDVCHKGHAFTEDNTMWNLSKGKKAKRSCRICYEERMKRNNEKKRSGR